MCQDASLLIYECTNSFIPELIQRGKKGAKVRTRDMEPSLMEKNGTMKNLREIDPVGEEVEARKKREEARRVEVREKAVGRGHSTPDEVGEFARDIRARRVVVNHFSSMYVLRPDVPQLLMIRFPSPRYITSEPYPFILSETSPLPYPTPSQHDIKPLPLQAHELHLRLILQSIARQIDEIWAPNGQSATVLARDFMVMQVPGHELSDSEKEVVQAHLNETSEVTASWIERRKDLNIPGIDEYQG